MGRRRHRGDDGLSGNLIPARRVGTRAVGGVSPKSWPCRASHLGRMSIITPKLSPGKGRWPKNKNKRALLKYRYAAATAFKKATERKHGSQGAASKVRHINLRNFLGLDRLSLALSGEDVANCLRFLETFLHPNHCFRPRRIRSAAVQAIEIGLRVRLWVAPRKPESSNEIKAGGRNIDPYRFGVCRSRCICDCVRRNAHRLPPAFRWPGSACVSDRAPAQGAGPEQSRLGWASSLWARCSRSSHPSA